MTTLTLTLSGAADATDVKISGPWWEWGLEGPVATNNTDDGTWTVLFDPKPADVMEYKWLIDGEQEDLLIPYNAGECTVLVEGERFASNGLQWGNRYWDPSLHGTSDTDYASACADANVNAG